MVSRGQKKAAAAAAAPLHEKLQLLRSITNSHARNDASIIVDASNYIEALKQKVELLNQDIASSRTTDYDQRFPFPLVTVETLDKGFLINVCSEKSCPGLLVSILEAFEELHLNVLEARVSCTDSFQLQAVAGENGEQGESISAQLLKQTVWQAINSWIQSTDQE